MRNGRGRRKFEFIDGSITKPTDKERLLDWRCVQAMLVQWILNTIDPSVKQTIPYFEEAEPLWNLLRDHEERFHQFLYGINEELVRSNLLSQYPFPTLDRAYQTLIQEERLRNSSRVPSERDDVLTFAVRTDGTRYGNNSYNGRDKSDFKCSYCDRYGHDVKNCFSKNGYPAWWGDRPRTPSRGSGRGRGNVASSQQQQQHMAGASGRGKGGAEVRVVATGSLGASSSSGDANTTSLPVEEANFKATTELFSRKGDGKTLDSFIPKSESDFLEYAELISHKLRPYEKSYHYVGLLKAVMRLSTASLKAANAKEVAASVTAIANEKLKAEKDANADEEARTELAKYAELAKYGLDEEASN
uniref:Eukaryotic translation initiation factor 3 30 kDa subunit n=1 Tax=Chenopodium quinoa TaxID=63459 RepID=A0A803KWU7_CHEQI